MQTRILTMDEYEKLSSPRKAIVQQGKETRLADGKVATPVVIKRPGFRDVRGVVVFEDKGWE